MPSASEPSQAPGTLIGRRWDGGLGGDQRGLLLVDAAPDRAADVVLVEPQAVGLAVEIGLATHALVGPEARAEADAEDVPL